MGNNSHETVVIFCYSVARPYAGDESRTVALCVAKRNFLMFPAARHSLANDIGETAVRLLKKSVAMRCTSDRFEEIYKTKSFPDRGLVRVLVVEVPNHSVFKTEGPRVCMRVEKIWTQQFRARKLVQWQVQLLLEMRDSH